MNLRPSHTMLHRILTLLFILFFARIDLYSQVDKNPAVIYDSVPGIILVTNDTLFYKIGIFKMGGLGGELLQLDSTMHFQKRVYSDLPVRGILDSGNWFLNKPGMITLKSQHGFQTFDLIKYRHFYFCIPPNQRGNFVADLLRSQKQYKNFKPIPIGDNVFTADDLAAYSLRKKYYLQDLNDW